MISLAVGQLWEVRGRGLFRLETLEGPDCCYPIVLRELARCTEYVASLEWLIKSYAEVEPAHLNAERAERYRAQAVMEQEQAWFDRRPDVQLWTGTVEAFRAREALSARGSA